MTGSDVSPPPFFAARRLTYAEIETLCKMPEWRGGGRTLNSVKYQEYPVHVFRGRDTFRHLYRSRVYFCTDPNKDKRLLRPQEKYFERIGMITEYMEFLKVEDDE